LPGATERFVARALSQTLANPDPKNLNTQQLLLLRISSIGNAEWGRKGYTEAIGWFEKGLAVAMKFERPQELQREIDDFKQRIAACKKAIAK